MKIRLNQNIFYQLFLIILIIFFSKGSHAESNVIRAISFNGNREFSDRALQNVVDDWIGKPLTISHLIAMRSEITEYYVDRGYVTSAAYIPEQAVEKGRVTVNVIEGRLGRIKIEGIDASLKSYVRSVIHRKVDHPLNQKELLEALQLLQLNPLFAQVDAELIEGGKKETSLLVLNLEPARSWLLEAEVSNTENPDFGVIQGDVSLMNQNLLGFGDTLRGRFRFTEGVNSSRIAYSIPFNGGQQELFFRKSDNDVSVISDLEGLSVSSVADTFSTGISLRLADGVSERLVLGLRLDVRDSQTFLNREPFAFNLGTLADDGETQVRVLRLSGTYSKRGADYTLTAQSRFSFGLDWFGATENEFDFDGSFVSWLGTLQYVKQVNENWRFSSELATQLTADSLLPLEQIAIGGIDSVRGFERNVRSGDNGVLLSTELQWSLNRDLALIPFFDLGVVWNNDFALEGVDREVISPSLLSSLGMGVRWQLTDALELQGNLGIPLVRNEAIEQWGTVQLKYRSRF